MDHTLPWNTLLPGLQAATILGQGRGQGSTFCTLSCKKRSEVSHTCKYYALIRILSQAYVDSLAICEYNMSGEKDNYTLTVGGYDPARSTIYDAFSSLDGYPFSTKDNINIDFQRAPGCRRRLNATGAGWWWRPDTPCIIILLLLL